MTVVLEVAANAAGAPSSRARSDRRAVIGGRRQ
jgi:hypothetical protein